MHYYERHLGDYARDTGHLSLLEHGVYGVLLDRYYSTEEPIPAAQAYRIARARTDDERAAVDAVLAEFFVLDGEVWRHRRADEEILKAQNRIAAARENGKRGGNPKKKAGYNEPGFLYAIQRQAGGRIKVGITKHPAQRMSDLRAKNGPIRQLALLAVEDMGRCEAQVHGLFAQHLDGEWIDAPEDAVLSACRAVAEGCAQAPDSGAGLAPDRAPESAGDPVTHQPPDTRHHSAVSSSQHAARAPADAGAAMTDAGRACRLMREAGCATTNPAHPDLLAALAEGCTPEELAATVAEAITGGIRKPFPWAISTARGRRAAGPRPMTTGATHAHPDHGTAAGGGPRLSLADRAAQRAQDILARRAERERAAG